MRIWWKYEPHGDPMTVRFAQPTLALTYCESLAHTDSDTASNLAARYLDSIGATLFEGDTGGSVIIHPAHDSVQPLFVEVDTPELLISVEVATEESLAALIAKHVADLDKKLLLMINTLVMAAYEHDGVLPEHIAIHLRSRPTPVHTEHREPSDTPKVGSLAFMHLSLVGSMEPPLDFSETFTDIQWGSRTPSFLDQLGQDSPLGTDGDVQHRINVARAWALEPTDTDPATWEAEFQNTRNPIEINEPKTRRLGFADIERKLRFRTGLTAMRIHHGKLPSGAFRLP